MGLDYIRVQAGKPYEKRWAKGLNRLKTPTLLDVAFSSEARIITAAVMPGCVVREGTPCLLQVTESGELAVMSGCQQIAAVASPPSDLTKALASQHGLAPATVERVSIFGTSAELKF